MIALLLSLGLAVAAPAEELRGVWVTRWSFKDEAAVETLLDQVKAAGFNAVYFQVRGRFDAFYDSKHEPWARELSGTLGKDPGWDPLEVAVAGAHERDLQLHAWVNTFPMWSGKRPPPLKTHAYNTHRDWVVTSEEGRQPLSDHYVFADPMVPAVRDHVVAVMADIDARYDVDGIHFDYLRYPDPKWGRGTPDERRQAVEATVRATQLAVDVPVTAAVWGIYSDDWGWRSSAGNRDYYQDTRSMLKTGALDAAVPMIYWPVRDKGVDFDTLAKDHVAHAADRHVYTGLDATKLSWEQVLACISSARSAGAQGVVFFEFNAVRDKGWVDKLARGPFAEPAAAPTMPWRATPPAPDSPGSPAPSEKPAPAPP